MDRFKFRAWDKKERKFILDIQEVYDSCPKGATYCISSFASFLDKERYIVEQCTCLKDKNGKLAFSGDIFKTHNGKIRTIRSVKGGFAFEVNKKMTAYESLSDMQNSRYFSIFCEIIGNIHENPELL